MSTAAQIETLRTDLLAHATAHSRHGTSSEMRSALINELVPLYEAAAFLEVLAVDPGTARENLRTFAEHTFRLDPDELGAPAPAITARGHVLARTTTGGRFELPAGGLVLEHPTTSARYRSTEAARLTSKASRVRIESENMGEAQRAASATVFTAIYPPGVVVATADGHVLGGDLPSVEAVRAGILSPDAVSRAARRARRSDATLLGFTRAREHDGFVSVAGSSAIPSSSPDLAALAAAIGKPASQVINVTNVAVDVSYSLEVDDAEAPASAVIEIDVASRLAAYLRTLPIGPSTLHLSALDTVVRTAFGMKITSLALPVVDAIGLLSCSIDTPVANVALLAHQRAVLGTVSATIVRV